MVVALSRFAAELASPATPAPERLAALKWVVHLTADLHQPLHDEDHDDKGGNEIRLTYFVKRTNLHAVWDGGIIEQATDLRLGPDYSFDRAAVAAVAADLDRRIPPGLQRAWIPQRVLAALPSPAIGWANDSHALAQQAYAAMPDRRSRGWEGAYQASA